jgi:hypothetical protein
VKPVDFKGQNVVFGKGQPEYRELPAYRAPDGTVTTCWQLTDEELAAIMHNDGKFWIQQLTFNQTFQPQLPWAHRPVEIPYGKETDG